jgi:hypothetical protein
MNRKKTALVARSRRTPAVPINWKIAQQGYGPPRMNASNLPPAPLSKSGYLASGLWRQLRAFCYIEFLQSRLHPVRGKGRSHLNSF